MKRKLWLVGMLGALLLAMSLGVMEFVSDWGPEMDDPSTHNPNDIRRPNEVPGTSDLISKDEGQKVDAGTTTEGVSNETGEDDAENTPEALEEAAEEAAVDSFDAMTDQWMKPAKKGVKMTDIDAFVAQFKKVPSGRKEECLQRALNLIPDENVMILAGILMDKSQPKELIELVFNDVLNRDEDVKKPILQQIFKDKTHPCWADTAWILEVTRETPTNTEPAR